jgi:hypothetical protein
VRPGKKSTKEEKARKADILFKALASQISDARASFGKAVDMVRKDLSKTSERLFNNQNLLNNGLTAAENHAILSRRVLNDMLNGVVRTISYDFTKVKDGDFTDNVTNIHWNWYDEQAYFQLSFKKDISIEAFTSGHTLSDEEIEVLKLSDAKSKIQKLVYYSFRKEKDVKNVKVLFDTAIESDCSDLFQFISKNLPEHNDWREAAELLGDEVVHGVVIEATTAVIGAFQKREAKKMKDLLKENEKEKSKKRAADLLEKVSGLPANDPDEVKKEADKLLDESNAFAKKAGEAVKLLDEGKMAEANKVMAELEAKVSEVENRQLPEGAAIFGG